MNCFRTDRRAILPGLLLLSACGTDAPDQAAVPTAAKVPEVMTSPGKPTAPVSISYEVMGKPIVGQPVSVNIVVTSAAGPVDLRYGVVDRSGLVLQEGQVERIEIADPSSGSVQQISVIPQREGRLFVNVSVEVQTPGGSMIRSIAIPINAGSTPAVSTPIGEVLEGPGGERVVSLPAEPTP